MINLQLNYPLSHGSGKGIGQSRIPSKISYYHKRVGPMQLIFLHRTSQISPGTQWLGDENCTGTGDMQRLIVGTELNQSMRITQKYL